MNNKLGIIHPDETIARLIQDYARNQGYDSAGLLANASTPTSQTVDFVSKEDLTLLLLGESLGNGHPRRGEGLAHLEAILKQHPELPVIMVSGGPSFRDRAIQIGAKEYLITGNINELKELLVRYKH